MCKYILRSCRAAEVNTTAADGIIKAIRTVIDSKSCKTSGQRPKAWEHSFPTATASLITVIAERLAFDVRAFSYYIGRFDR